MYSAKLGLSSNSGVGLVQLFGFVVHLRGSLRQFEHTGGGTVQPEQRVVVEQHQYVTRVEDGGQAVIGPKVRTRGGVRNGGGR